jgi:hypothetical protein
MTNLLAFRFLGAGKVALVSRLFLLLFVGVPLLLIRCSLAVIVGGGVMWAGLAATASGTGVFAVAYRPIIEWMHTSPTFQEVWRVALTEVLPYALNIILFAVKLLLEVWNGFCPFLAKVVDVIFDLALRLALMLWNQGILQRMLTWITRLIVFMVEPITDALVAVLESLLWAEEWVSDFDIDASGALGAGAEAAKCATEEATEMLLAIVVITLTNLVRYLQLLWSLLLPLMYGFFRIVVPRLIKVIPDILELISQFFSLFTTDPAKRVFRLLIEAFPLIIEQVKIVICSVGIYGASIACLLAATFLKFVSFWIKEVAGPVVCGGMSFMTGCLWSWIQMKLNNVPCFNCGHFNTGCGCTGKVNGANIDKTDWACVGTCSDTQRASTVPGVRNQPHPPPPPTQTPDGVHSYNHAVPANTRRGGTRVPDLPLKTTRRVCNEVVVNGVARCTNTPALLRDVPPSAHTQATELTKVANYTASSTAYAPLLIHHVESPSGVPLAYYSHGALPAQGPGGATLATSHVHGATQRHRLGMQFAPGAYGPALLKQPGGPGWSPSRGGPVAWLRVKFPTEKCLSASTIVWGNHPPMAYNVTFLSGAPDGPSKVVVVSPPCGVGGDAGRADRIPIGTTVVPSWQSALLAPAGWPDLGGQGAGPLLCAPLVVSHRELGLLFASLGAATRGVRPPPHVLQQEAETRALVVGALEGPCCTGAQVAQAVHHYRSAVETACLKAGPAGLANLLLVTFEQVILAWRPTSAPVQMVAAHAIEVRFVNTVCPEHDDALHSDWAAASHQGLVHMTSMRTWGFDMDKIGLLGFPPVSKAHAALHAWQSRTPTMMHKPTGGLFVHGHIASESGLRMWDPCGRCTLIALSDGEATVPNVFYFGGEGEGKHAEIEFTTQSATTGKGAAARVASVAVVFGANSHVPHTMVCTRPGGVDCVNATGHDDSYLHTMPIVPHKFRQGGPNNTTTQPLPSSFAPHVARDTALRFELPTFAASQTFYLRFTARAPPIGGVHTTARWGAVKQDHFLHDSGPNRWMHTLATHAPYMPNANLGGGEYPAWCSASYYEGELADAHQWQPTTGKVCKPTAAWYNDPFEGEGRAHWSVTEVMVDMLPDTLATGRRTTQTPEVPRSKLDLLADTMAGRPTVDHGSRGAPEPVHSALRRGPIRDSHHSPFPRDIKSMPDPADEPVLVCQPFTAKNQSRRMLCTNPPPLALGTSPTQGGPTTPQGGPTTAPTTGWVDGGLAAELGLDPSEMEAVRHHAARTIALGDREISNRAIIQALYVLRQAGSPLTPPATGAANETSVRPASRGLLGSPEDWLNDILAAVSNALKDWVQCPTVCGPWDCSLGECLMHLPVYAIQSLIGCNNNSTDTHKASGEDRADLFTAIMSCFLYIVKWLFEKLDLLSAICKLIDKMMEALAEVVLDNPKQIACQACAVATSVADMVEEWAKVLEPGKCFDFLDVGVNMCAGWGLSFGELVPKLVESMYGSVKLGFMLALTLPALAELTIEWGVLFTGTLISVFPDLLGDAFQIIMWVVSSSSVLKMIEPMFEAIDPLMDQLTDSLGGVASCTAQTLTKQKTAAFSDREGPPNAAASGTALGGVELCKPAGPNTAACGSATISEEDYDGYEGAPGDASGMRIDSVAAGVAACGCVPKPPDCSGANAGGAACKYREGDYDKAIQTRADKKGEMKGCPSGGILAQGQAGGSQSEQVEARDTNGKACKLKPLQAKANVTAATPIDIFSDFSSSQVNYGFVLLNQGEPPSARPHFRNLLWEDPNPQATSTGVDPLAGLRLLVQKDMAGESHFDRESRIVAEGIANFTSLYASMVVAIHEAGAPLLAASGWRAEVMRATNTFASASRSLLASTPGNYDAQLENTTCDAGSTTTIDDPNNPGTKLVFKASTWACCRGLWCCIPPLPQDFRFESEWFRWRPWWYTDTKCAFVDSWPKAALYGARALCKLLHDATLTVDRWPLDGALSWLYDQVSFEGNEWPEDDPAVHATCLVMNSGYVWVLLAVLLTIMLVASPCSQFIIAVAMLLLDCSKQLLLLLSPLFWCATSIRNLKEKKSN